MTTEQETTTDVTADVDPDDSKTSQIEHVRLAKERADERAEKAETTLRNMAFKAVGLDPDKKIAEAAASSFEGEWDDTDALAEHLLEGYDWKTSGSDKETAKAVDASQNRLNAVTAASSSADEPDATETGEAAIEEARGKRDNMTSIALQSDHLIASLDANR